VRLFSSWAVRDLVLDLRLLTEPGNERSQRVAERSGFVRTGVLAEDAAVDGRRVDQVLFSLPPAPTQHGHR
jgi:RimJ/RimL family protein N-acetyltransferase